MVFGHQYPILPFKMRLNILFGHQYPILPFNLRPNIVFGHQYPILPFELGRISYLDINILFCHSN